MKKNLLIIFISILSCNSYERNKFEYRSSRKVIKNSQENFFIKQFKDETFYKCLEYGYNENKLGDSIFYLMAKKDLFSPSDDPNLKIDSIQNILAKKIITNLPPPYLHVEDEKSLEGKNFIMSTCLSYYESRELDSIAKKLYKEKIKEDKKLWGKDNK